MGNTIILALICILLFALIVFFIKKYFEYINPFVEEIILEGPIVQKAGDETNIGYYYDIKKTYKNGKVVYIRKNHKTSTKYDKNDNIV